MSYTFETSGNIRTLSTNGASGGADITGLLYTPELDPNDQCFNLTRPYVPENAVRRVDLPDTEYALVAIAPWLRPDCTLAYLTAARNANTQGFLFFKPDNSSAEPPPANDVEWSLGDGGNWKSANLYPVYALDGVTGYTLINATAQYGGNISTVPHAQQLLETYRVGDSLRLVVDVDTGTWNITSGTSGTSSPPQSIRGIDIMLMRLHRLRKSIAEPMGVSFGRLGDLARDHWFYFDSDALDSAAQKAAAAAACCQRRSRSRGSRHKAPYRASRIAESDAAVRLRIFAASGVAIGGR